MKLDTIGANIRKWRLSKMMRQEDLAEKTDLSVTYIGMIERGEKTPSLETLIAILNAIGISADMVLYVNFRHNYLGILLYYRAVLTFYTSVLLSKYKLKTHVRESFVHK